MAGELFLFGASIAQVLPREQKNVQGQASDAGDRLHDSRRRQLHRGRVRFQVGARNLGTLVSRGAVSNNVSTMLSWCSLYIYV